jgi:hypothetical protein
VYVESIPRPVRECTADFIAWKALTFPAADEVPMKFRRFAGRAFRARALYAAHAGLDAGEPER